MNWSATLIPVGTLILGAALSETSSWLSDRRKDSQVVRVAAAQRDREIETRRESFELDLLTRLTGALLEFGRAYGEAHFLDARTARTSGTYAGSPLPAEVNEHVYTAGREMLALMNMILDEDLRAVVRASYDAMIAVASLRRATLAQGEAAFDRATALHAEALEAVAARIRAIYIEQSPAG